MNTALPPTAREQKRALRQQYLELRRAIPHGEWRAKSDAIAEKVLALPDVEEGHTLLTYVSSKDNEVDTVRIIEQMLSRGKRVAVPRITGRGLMEWRLIISMEDLEPGQFGVLEPKPSQTELYEDFEVADTCLVPGIVWDKSRYRIGYGLGFYDRFLEDFFGGTYGLTFADFLVESLPMEPHDLRTDHVLTD